jgi:hypothetical protein
LNSVVNSSLPAPPPELNLASARLIIPRPRGAFFGRDTGGEPPSEISVLVPPDVLFPGTSASEATLLETLVNLRRDDTLFECARANIIVTGAALTIQQGANKGCSTGS